MRDHQNPWSYSHKLPYLEVSQELSIGWQITMVGISVLWVSSLKGGKRLAHVWRETAGVRGSVGNRV